MEDRKRWKTLRDFVDDQAIEDTMEMIETERSNLDVSHRYTTFCYKHLISSLFTSDS